MKNNERICDNLHLIGVEKTWRRRRRQNWLGYGSTGHVHFVAFLAVGREPEIIFRYFFSGECR